RKVVVPSADARQASHRLLPGAPGGACGGRSSTPSSARCSSPPGYVADTRAGTAGPAESWVVVVVVTSQSTTRMSPRQVAYRPGPRDRPPQGFRGFGSTEPWVDVDLGPRPGAGRPLA